MPPFLPPPPLLTRADDVTPRRPPRLEKAPPRCECAGAVVAVSDVDANRDEHDVDADAGSDEHVVADSTPRVLFRKLKRLRNWRAQHRHLNIQNEWISRLAVKMCI